jgi:hypothetical protein
MPAIVCNASSSTMCPRKPNSIQNASIFYEFPEQRFEPTAKLQTATSATKMRSRWRPRWGLFISKSPKSRRCCTTFIKVRALASILWGNLWPWILSFWMFTGFAIDQNRFSPGWWKSFVIYIPVKIKVLVKAT